MVIIRLVCCHNMVQFLPSYIDSSHEESTEYDYVDVMRSWKGGESWPRGFCWSEYCPISRPCAIQRKGKEEMRGWNSTSEPWGSCIIDLKTKKCLVIVAPLLLRMSIDKHLLECDRSCDSACIYDLLVQIQNKHSWTWTQAWSLHVNTLTHLCKMSRLVWRCLIPSATPSAIFITSSNVRGGSNTPSVSFIQFPHVRRGVWAPSDIFIRTWGVRGGLKTPSTFSIHFSNGMQGLVSPLTFFVSSSHARRALETLGGRRGDKCQTDYGHSIARILMEELFWLVGVGLQERRLRGCVKDTSLLVMKCRKDADWW